MSVLGQQIHLLVAGLERLNRSHYASQSIRRPWWLRATNGLHEMERRVPHLRPMILGCGNVEEATQSDVLVSWATLMF